MTLFPADPRIPTWALGYKDDWAVLLRRRPNLLISGNRETADAFVLALTPYFGPPVRRLVCAASLRLPAAGGTLILDGVEALNGQQQKTLFCWLDACSHPEVQVISVAPTALYTYVEAGTFLDALYYRLNMVHLEVGPICTAA